MEFDVTKLKSDALPPRSTVEVSGIISCCVVVPVVYGVIGIVTGGAFGIAMAVYFFDFTVGVLTGIAFGIIFAALLGSRHIWRTLRSGARTPLDFFRSKRTKTFEVSLPFEKAFSLAQTSLDDAHVLDKDEEIGLVVLLTEQSADSFGERVTLQLRDRANRTSITVTTKPEKFALMDYGKSLRNIRRIEQCFDREARTFT